MQAVEFQIQMRFKRVREFLSRHDSPGRDLRGDIQGAGAGSEPGFFCHIRHQGLHLAQVERRQAGVGIAVKVTAAKTSGMDRLTALLVAQGGGKLLLAADIAELLAHQYVGETQVEGAGQFGKYRLARTGRIPVVDAGERRRADQRKNRFAGI